MKKKVLIQIKMMNQKNLDPTQKKKEVAVVYLFLTQKEVQAIHLIKKQNLLVVIHQVG